MSPWTLAGKFAVVTAGSEGIGLAIVEELIAVGARVLAVSRSEEKLATLRRKMPAAADLVSIAADLSTKAGRDQVVAHVFSVGGLDVLMNNLGMADRDDFVAMDSERSERQLQLNLVATLELTRALFPMLRVSRGSVVNVTSVSAQRALPQRLWYGAAKAALEHATRSLATEWGPHGIRVNAVAPWFTATAMTAKTLGDPVLSAKILGLTPLRRIAEPADVGRVAVFLALPAASYVTGAVLPVDGGYLAQGGLG